MWPSQEPLIHQADEKRLLISILAPVQEAGCGARVKGADQGFSLMSYTVLPLCITRRRKPA